MIRILFIGTIYRCGQKVYPILDALADKYDVEFLAFSEMSSETEWYGDIDPRITFKDHLRSIGIKVIEGPGKDTVIKQYDAAKFHRRCRSLVDYSSFNLAIIDDNVSKEAWGTPTIYRILNEFKVPVIGCPHGNREKDIYIGTNIGRSYDYSFSFGDKETRWYPDLSGKIFPAGIPSNDILGSMVRCKRHILCIINYVTTDKSRTGFTAMSKEFWNSLRIRDIQQKFGLPIVFKMKSRFHGDVVGDFGDGWGDGFEFVLDGDNNKLVTDSAYVISAASTFAFSPIQVGIPTAILRECGMVGNFYDFNGLIDSNYNAVVETLLNQDKHGRDNAFINDTLAGGLEYNSVGKYLDCIGRLT